MRDQKPYDILKGIYWRWTTVLFIVVAVGVGLLLMWLNNKWDEVQFLVPFDVFLGLIIGPWLLRMFFIAFKVKRDEK